MRSKLILLLGLLYCSSGYGIVTLIGIANNASGVSAGKPIVRVRGESNSIDITGTDFNNTNYKLPVSIDISYGLGDDVKVYTIIIEDKSTNLGCSGNSHVVQAKVQFNGSDIPNQVMPICIPSTISAGIVGSNALQWQNIILAIADNSKYTKGAAIDSDSYLPFLFGISSWTTTLGNWANPTISKVVDGSTKFSTPLNVIQGYAGWGGDASLPRFGFGHIIDVYNNTNYILDIKRKSKSTELAKNYFDKLVPPMSAVPKAMAWIPKRSSDDSKSALIMYAMYAPNPNDDNPPDPSSLDPITNAGGSELSPTTASAQDIVNNIKSSVPSLIDQLTGRKTISSLISDNYAQYSINKYYFKIYSDEKTKFIKVERCSNKTNECELINTIKSPVTNSAGAPNYFRLVVQKDDKYGINFNIDSLPADILKEYLGSGVTQ